MQFGDFVWLDWANVPGLFDYIGFGLGAIGLFVALRQLFKSKGALKAAKEALDTTRRNLMSNQLSVVLPKLQTLSMQLDSALIADDRDETRVQLFDFILFSSEAGQLFESTRLELPGKRMWPKFWTRADSTREELSPDDAALVAALISAAYSAETAKAGFFEGTRTATQVAGPAAAEIGRVVSQVQRAMTRKMNNVMEANHG